MTTLSIDQLPEPAAISQPDIAAAATEFATARAALNERKRDVVELEQTRSNAEWADAQAEHDAVAAGKPAPTKQKHTAEHDVKLEKARHAHKVATLAEQSARRVLASKLEQYGDRWLAEAEKLVRSLDASWDSIVQTAAKIHAERRRAIESARKLGSEHVGAGAAFLDRRVLQGIELPHGAAQSWAVYGEDLLDALGRLGTPQSKPDAPKLGMPDHVAGQLGRVNFAPRAEGADVDAERAGLPTMAEARARAEAAETAEAAA